jgi:hypothetical protein
MQAKPPFALGGFVSKWIQFFCFISVLKTYLSAKHYRVTLCKHFVPGFLPYQHQQRYCQRTHTLKTDAQTMRRVY